MYVYLVYATEEYLSIILCTLYQVSSTASYLKKVVAHLMRDYRVKIAHGNQHWF